MRFRERFAQARFFSPLLSSGTPVIFAALIAVTTSQIPLQAQQAPTQANLAPEDSAALQRLLRLQDRHLAVQFNQCNPPRTPVGLFDRLLMWNEIALDTTAIDHTPVQPDEVRVFGEQFGPTRASRAMAIVHIAMFEAVNAAHGRFRSYTGLHSATRYYSLDYALAQSAHDALVYLYPSQHVRLDALLSADLATIQGDPASLTSGKEVGTAAAASIVALRSADGSQIPDPRAGNTFPLIGGVGHWSPDPVSHISLYLGAYWGKVKPFTLTSGDQFRAPPPPDLTSSAYTNALYQVKTKGGDPRFGTPTLRTDEETVEGIFWSYDGTPGLCAPPRLYNQVARSIVLEQGMNQVCDAARMLAMINTAMADAAIAAWDSKWYYQLWRPVTAIRSAQQNGNTSVVPDPDWYPLGSQATNTHGPNFTPPFPAYVSGHAAIGGALFQAMRHYYPDTTPFTLISDEWNGLNRDVTGAVRPLRAHFFSTFTEAENQNAESRIYLGVHWQFDSDEGIVQGRQVADWVWDHAFQPVGEGEHR